MFLLLRWLMKGKKTIKSQGARQELLMNLVIFKGFAFKSSWSCKTWSGMAFKELDSNLWVFAISTAHWARLGFNMEEEDGFTSVEVGVGLFLVSDAGFVFTSVL